MDGITKISLKIYQLSHPICTLKIARFFICLENERGKRWTAIVLLFQSLHRCPLLAHVAIEALVKVKNLRKEFQRIRIFFSGHLSLHQISVACGALFALLFSVTAVTNGRFRTQNVNKIDQKKNCDQIFMLRSGFGRKNQLNWSFQSVAPSRMIHIRLQGVPTLCYISPTR